MTDELPGLAEIMGGGTLEGEIEGSVLGLDPQRIVTESKLRALAREKATLDREAVDTFLAYEEYGRLPRPEPSPKFLP